MESTHKDGLEARRGGNGREWGSERLLSDVDDSYRSILERADRHFETAQRDQPQNINCRAGCTLCCHGLFEITSADVAVIANGLKTLSRDQREHLVARAHQIMSETRHPNLREVSEDEKEAFFARTEGVPCAALDSEGRCSIYADRPLVCRTFGIPLRDGQRYLGEVCELNFTGAAPGEGEAVAWDLQWEDVIGTDDQYTVAEAIILAARLCS